MAEKMAKKDVFLVEFLGIFSGKIDHIKITEMNIQTYFRPQNRFQTP